MGLFLLVYTLFLCVLISVFVLGYKYGKKKNLMEPMFPPQASGLLFGLLFAVPAGSLMVGLIKFLAYLGFGIW